MTGLEIEYNNHNEVYASRNRILLFLRKWKIENGTNLSCIQIHINF